MFYVIIPGSVNGHTSGKEGNKPVRGQGLGQTVFFSVESCLREFSCTVPVRAFHFFYKQQEVWADAHSVCGYSCVPWAAQPLAVFRF